MQLPSACCHSEFKRRGRGACRAMRCQVSVSESQKSQEHPKAQPPSRLCHGKCRGLEARGGREGGEPGSSPGVSEGSLRRRTEPGSCLPLQSWSSPGPTMPLPAMVTGGTTVFRSKCSKMALAKVDESACFFRDSPSEETTHKGTCSVTGDILTFTAKAWRCQNQEIPGFELGLWRRQNVLSCP